MDVDGLVRTPVGLVPDLGQQLALGRHPSRVARQVREQVELLAAQVEGLAVEARDPARGVDMELTDHQGVRCG